MQRSTLATIAVIVALTAAVFTGTTIARSSRVAPPAPVIATINIQTIFEQMSERKDKLDQLQKEANTLEDSFKIKSAALQRDREEAVKMTDGPAKDARLEEIVDKDVLLNIEVKKAKAKLEKAQADTIRALFAKIQAEASRYAALNGYSMVMVADDWVTISTRATAQEATQVMSLRRFLYVDGKQHDITPQILKALNDAHAASKPPAPAAPAPAPAATTPPAAPAAPAPR